MESILSQTYKNIEIILVDDGSPDNCPAICDAYASMHENILAVHKANGGLTSAWKEGVRHASADFVGFMDSSGIGVIIGRCKNVRFSGGYVKAVHLNEQIRRIFQLSGLRKIMEVE